MVVRFGPCLVLRASSYLVCLAILIIGRPFLCDGPQVHIVGAFSLADVSAKGAQGTQGQRTRITLDWCPRRATAGADCADDDIPGLSCVVRAASSPSLDLLAPQGEMCWVANV
jgi:hypothetical protein